MREKKREKKRRGGREKVEGKGREKKGRWRETGRRGRRRGKEKKDRKNRKNRMEEKRRDKGNEVDRGKKNRGSEKSEERDEENRVTMGDKKEKKDKENKNGGIKKMEWNKRRKKGVDKETATTENNTLDQNDDVPKTTRNRERYEKKGTTQRGTAEGAKESDGSGSEKRKIESARSWQRYTNACS